MPCSSAATASSTSSRGANCSADALYPSFSSATRSFYSCPDRRDPPRPAPPRLRSLLHTPTRPAAPGSAALAIASTLAGMGSAPTLVQVTDTVHLAQGEAVNWTLVVDGTG